MIQSRTHTCGELRLADVNKQVTLAGWMENVRVVSANLAFVVVRDFYGTTQVVAETAEMVFNQIRSLDITYKYLNVLEIISKDDYKIVKTNKEEITCKNVVIATGRISRELGLSNEKKLLSNGVSYCAICDGTLYKDKIVCVVGGGNSALESAMYLSYICSKVYLIHRNDEYRAEGILVDKLLQKSNIECIKNARITELKETNDKLSSVVINNDKEIICDGIFIEIGNVPVPIKCDGLKLDDNYIVVDSSMKTSVDGVYACGDIIKKEVYQISTAVGEGTMAAVSIIRS